MSSWHQPPHMRNDNLSIEVNGVNSYIDLSQTNSGIDQLFDFPLGDDSVLIDNNLAGICDEADLIGSIATYVESNDLATNFGPTVISSYEVQNCDWLVNGFALDQVFDNDQNFPITDGLPNTITSRNHKVSSNQEPTSLLTFEDTSIPLKVIESPRKIEILCDLEEKFRPRYKTDYFALNGTIRKPRYVTDRSGNHYISLRIPAGIRGVIRVDWLTLPDANKQRYSMPYKFQQDNTSSEIPDQNPIYREIETDASGIMKLYLVLIKAKQDALKLLQPLQPFHPWKEIFGMSNKSDLEKVPKLTAKQLINKYQLTKSQLAFTLCTVDEGTCIPEWTTTVYSSILEEESADNMLEKLVTCPNCLFEMPANDLCSIDEDVSTNKRKPAEKKRVERGSAKKRKFRESTIYLFE